MAHRHCCVSAPCTTPIKLKSESWLECRCVARLPGEAEEDVDDGGCQIDTLLPVFPQDPGQRAQSSLCGRADKTLNAFIAHEKNSRCEYKMASLKYVTAYE